MSGQNIKPEAVAPAAAASILATVNGAVSAEALAAQIELPNEPDIGLRLAANILERRTELGGSFASLAQLLTVKLLGPVRFSRVVRAILGQVEGLIRPEDVSEADAAKILAFLNGAETAQALADGIELPNEPDIGLQLGAHILERRAELGGSFTSLDQLLTVKLIGPVRFTRIVRAILGITGVGRDEFDDLAAQVQALQDALAAAPPRVVVIQVEPQRYLGQPLTLVATVTGRGRAAGRRRARDALRELGQASRLRRLLDPGGRQRDASAQRATASVRVTLLPPTSEGLEQAQQDAVESALGASTRRRRRLATRLRRSTRSFARTSSRRTTTSAAASTSTSATSASISLDSVNYRDELESWPTFDSAVVAYVHQLARRRQDRHRRRRLGRARRSCPRLARRLAPDAHRPRERGDARSAASWRSRPASPTRTTWSSRIHQSVGEYVSLQQGVVGPGGRPTGRRGKLGGFLESGIDVLPEEKQQALFPAVDTSSATVAQARRAGARRARADARRPARARRHAALDGDRAGARAVRRVLAGSRPRSRPRSTSRRSTRRSRASST